MKRPASAALAATILVLAIAAPVVAAAPSNDDIATPAPIGLPSETTLSTVEATAGPTDPSDCASGGPSVWFSYEAASSDLVRIQTFGSDYDTVLNVGVADGAGGIAVIDCNDDASGLTSAVTFEAVAGTTYLVVVGSFGGGNGGTLKLTLELAPPPPIVDLTVDAVGRFTPDGLAIIGGTIRCDQVTGAGIEVLVDQRVGRQVIRGSAFIDVACGEAASAWSAVVSGTNGKFLGGAATVAAFAFACSDESCVDGVSVSTVRLRR